MSVLAFLQHSVLLAVARGLLAYVFLRSVIGKARNPATFADAIAAYDLLPRRWTGIVAYLLLAAEATLGLLLLFGWQTKAAAWASGVLLLVFMVAVTINLARGRTDLDCGCHGPDHHEKIGARVLGRDAFLVLLSVLLALCGGGYLTVDHLSPAGQRWIFETVLVAVALPLVLTGIGLALLSKLLSRLGQLILLTPPE